MKKFEEALTYDPEPTRMNTRPAKGPGQKKFSLTQNAKYGVEGGGTPPTHMKTSVGRGKSGNKWDLGDRGPQKSSTSPRGANSSVGGRTYGVGGGGTRAGTGYGVGGV